MKSKYYFSKVTILKKKRKEASIQQNLVKPILYLSPPPIINSIIIVYKIQKYLRSRKSG